MNPRKGPRLGAEFENKLRAMWPVMSANEISDREGWKISLIYKWAKIWQLQHTPETSKRLFDRRQRNLQHSHTAEVVEKIRKARVHNDKMERFRIYSGMKQKTKYHISVIPNKTRFAMYNLCKLRNYFRDEDADSYNLYYDSKTNRANYHGYDEVYFSKKYGIQFIQADEDEPVTNKPKQNTK